MRTETVALRHAGADAAATATLREPTGRDEMAVEGVDTRAAVALLDRLLAASAPAPPDAARLAACDRDALLAALHRRCFGDRIVSTLTCAVCASRFDLSFDLSALQRQLATGGRGDGTVVGTDGVAYRVPVADDEMQAAGPGDVVLAVRRLARRCGIADERIAQASDALDAGAPIVDLELTAHCAECGHEELAHFDLQSFVLQRLLNERDLLLAEVDVLARTYGWSLREILSLPRSTRRHLAERASEAPSARG